MMAIGIIAFVAALMVSILLHEAGHLVTAKAFGMKATKYFAGFGPTLWSFRRGETEYGLKAIPAGGFVKIVGMTPLEEVEPGDEHRAFYRQPAGRRAVVLSAGSFMHFVIALVLIFLTYAAVGQSALSLDVQRLSACVPSTLQVAQDSDLCPTAGATPAKRLGLASGDRIVAFNGRRLAGWDDLAASIKRNAGQQVSVTYLHDGRTVTRTTVVDTTQGAHGRVGFLGIVPAAHVERVGPLSALERTGAGFADYSVATFKALGNIPAAIPKLFHSTVDGGTRSADGLVGAVGIGRLTGQLAASDAPVSDRIAEFLLIIAGLNIFVGVFNLLPLLPLDGGHLAVLGFEEGRRRVYRLAGRRDPGRVDLAKLLPAAYLVVALFVGLSVLLLLTDIVNPIKNPFTG